MKSSEALKKARIRIDKRINMHVCNAIFFSGGEDTTVYKNLSSLFNGLSVSSWLRNNSEDYCDFADIPTVDFGGAMREYRLRWIDWMIQQYEAVGD